MNYQDFTIRFAFRLIDELVTECNIPVANLGRRYCACEVTYISVYNMFVSEVTPHDSFATGDICVLEVPWLWQFHVLYLHDETQCPVANTHTGHGFITVHASSNPVLNFKHAEQQNVWTDPCLTFVERQLEIAR